MSKSLFLLSGEKSCTIWSSAGPVVQRGSSFEVYCTFNCKCKGSMYSYHPPIPQTHKEFNSTTLFLSVSKIAKNRTYSCQCSCPALDPCGLDISAGCEWWNTAECFVQCVVFQGEIWQKKEKEKKKAQLVLLSILYWVHSVHMLWAESSWVSKLTARCCLFWQQSCD